MLIFRREFILFGLFLFFLLAVPPARAQGPVPPAGPVFAPGEILVKFFPGVSSAGAQKSLQTEGLQPLEVLPRQHVVRVRVKPGQERAAIAKLLARGDVEIAEPNYQVYALDTFPNDYYNQWGLASINAPAAWDISGGSNVTIAIVDTGIDLDHEDFNCPGKLVPGYDFVNLDTQPDDDNGHGSHVAGIAAACSNNSRGISGVAWGAQLMPIKVLNASGSGYYSDLLAGIQFAVDNGARIINLSLGGTVDSALLKSAVTYAHDRGALVVAAAGNYGSAGNSIFYPAAYDYTLAVAATDAGDNWASFSEHHPYVDVAAPGVSIYSTWKNGVYATLSGTSMATPHVSGLAALIWSLEPFLARDDVWSRIESTSDDLGDPGRDDYFGYGRINAGRALYMAPISLQTAAGLDVSNGQVRFMVDSDEGPFPAAVPILVSTAIPNVITWTAVISSPASWLTITPGTSGLTSAGSPGQFTLTAASRPPDFGTYTATVTVTGTTASGTTLEPVVTTAVLTYLPDFYKYRLPMISRGAP